MPRLFSYDLINVADARRRMCCAIYRHSTLQDHDSRANRLDTWAGSMGRWASAFRTVVTDTRLSLRLTLVRRFLGMTLAFHS